jgi:RNA polymerase sigma factor (sigma-70 family)
MPSSYDKPRRNMSRSKDANDPDRFKDDLALIAEIQAGSTEHWQRFVERFSGLIYSVIRRQLFAEDEDDVRTVFADVLHDLYYGKLAEYEGRAELSTWLIVVSRGKALDFLRSRDGRRAMPAAYPDMTPLQQEVFRRYHAEGLPMEVVIDSLGRAGLEATVEEVAEAVLQIEERVDRHYLRRLETNARAKSLGVVSGRLLEFLAEMRFRADESESARPDRVLDRKERQARAAQVQELISRLYEEEQKALRLRYEREWTAKRISAELGLGSQRRVYTILDRAARKLRNLFKDNK